jgi:hypothetical protein
MLEHDHLIDGLLCRLQSWPARCDDQLGRSVNQRSACEYNPYRCQYPVGVQEALECFNKSEMTV